MRKLFLSITFAGIAGIALISCGGGSKKEETKENGGYETAEPEKTSPDKTSPEDLIAQGQALVESNDCKTCHHSTNKIIGPAHMDVAKKYEFTKANVEKLADKIIKGGSGVWGDIPMTAHADLSKTDAEKMAMYVLSLDGEKYKE